MSWDGFVDNIRQQCAVEKAAIIGVDGQIWGKSDNFSISGEECAKLANLFLNCEPAYSNGMIAEGEKYSFIRNVDDTIMGAKGASNLFMSKCNSCIIMTVCAGTPENNQGKMCLLAQQKFADYMKNQNY